MTILAARRIDYLTVPKPTSAWARSGLAFERKLKQALATHPECLAIHNPQFAYRTPDSIGHCIPDFILTNLAWLHPASAIVIECKLTYKPEAADKLTNLYVPVVQLAHGFAEVWPVILVKNLTAGAPEPSFSLEAAWNKTQTRAKIPSRRVPRQLPFVPVVQWLGRGDFPINA